MTTIAPARTAVPIRHPHQAGAVRASTAPRALVAVPTASREQHWDRVRFRGTTAAPRALDDAGADLVPRAAVATAPVPLEEPAAWCGSLVRAIVEALTGNRPAAQLARWVTADLYDSISRRAGLAVRINGRPAVGRQAVVRRVHLCAISPLAAEASVVVHDGDRVRAAAIRIEAHRGRWRATALEIG